MTTSPTQRPVDTPTVDPPTPVSGWKAALKRDAIRVPLLAWFVAHSIVVLVAVIAYAAFGFTGPPVDPSVTGPFTLLGTWDTTWYLGIARDGYTDQLTTLGQDEQYSNLAFFPLIPGLLWVFDAIGINPFFALLVVSHLAALVALVGFRALAADRMSAAQANLATWCFALFPSTLAASMAYTEAITLALTITAAWFATRGRWVPAALFAGVVTLARPTGFLAALLVGLIAWRSPGKRTLRRGFFTGLPGLLAMSGFLLFMMLGRGSATAPLQAQGAWGRGAPIIGMFTAAKANTQELWEQIVGWDPGGRWVGLGRDVLAVALFVVLMRRLARVELNRWLSPWVIYVGLALAIPLSTGTFNSMARLGIVAFPLFWMIPTLLAPQGRIPPRVWLITSAVLLAGATVHLTIASP